MTTIAPDDLAAEFCRVLNEWLSPEELNEITRRNALPKYETCCATHDFCDPNQAMADALVTFDLQFHPELCDLINSAWELAKKCQFQVR